MLGMTARQKRAMAYIPSGSIGLNTDISTLGYMLKWGLMGYKFTPGAADATSGDKTAFNTHEIWANDVRYFEKLCARVGKDEFEHVFSHLVMGSIEGSIEQEFLGLSAELTGSTDYEDTIKDVVTDIEPLLPEEYALAFHDINLFIDEDVTPAMINVSDIAKSLSFSVEGNVDSEGGVTLGSRHPRRHGSSGRSVSLSSELHFDSMEQKRAFWGALNGTKGVPGKLGSNTFPVEATIDSGKVFGQEDAYGEAVIRWPKCYYTAVPLSPSGREEMSSEVEINTLEDVVTLEDGITKVSTPMYAKIKNLTSDMSVAPV